MSEIKSFSDYTSKYNSNVDYSALFGGTSDSSSVGNTNMLSDYAAIKNGSYGKLMKAYYAKQDAEKLSGNNQNYSQFYRGTSTIDTYGGGASGKKQVVKYEFNTTDENGNKIMDKMSREETLSAMKEIRSQYGDDVIVEFSGDGMAVLVNSIRNCHPSFNEVAILVKT